MSVNVIGYRHAFLSVLSRLNFWVFFSVSCELFLYFTISRSNIFLFCYVFDATLSAVNIEFHRLGRHDNDWKLISRIDFVFYFYAKINRIKNHDNGEHYKFNNLQSNLGISSAISSRLSLGINDDFSNRRDGVVKWYKFVLLFRLKTFAPRR